jgi:hypothetical protein
MRDLQGEGSSSAQHHKPFNRLAHLLSWQPSTVNFALGLSENQHKLMERLILRI